ncbi:hypothetical protein J6590_012651 [Homalodisca vitripennis]|nr:hypothetical protein J6590_012651 [Homalodisca vitripennis]
MVSSEHCIIIRRKAHCVYCGISFVYNNSVKYENRWFLSESEEASVTVGACSVTSPSRPLRPTIHDR